MIEKMNKLESEEQTKMEEEQLFAKQMIEQQQGKAITAKLRDNSDTPGFNSKEVLKSQMWASGFRSNDY